MQPARIGWRSADDQQIQLPNLRRLRLPLLCSYFSRAFELFGTFIVSDLRAPRNRGPVFRLCSVGDDSFGPTGAIPGRAKFSPDEYA